MEMTGPVESVENQTAVSHAFHRPLEIAYRAISTFPQRRPLFSLSRPTNNEMCSRLRRSHHKKGANSPQQRTQSEHHRSGSSRIGMKLPGAMRAGFAQFLAFGQDAADNRTFLAQGKLQMPVLAFGGEATFGPMIGAVMRCVADNVEDVIIPDCGHWITEEQPQATTDLVVDFLHRR